MINYSIKSSVLDSRFIFTELEAVVNSSSGEIKNRIVSTMMDTFQNEVQKRLIELGWAPPVEVQRLDRKIAELRAELEVTDKLLAARNEVLELIPECETHGPQCVPHAKEWIENIKVCRVSMLDALSSIQRYGLDTLSGRVGGPDDKEWQRQAVNEMTKRARLAIEAATSQPTTEKQFECNSCDWKGPESETVHPKHVPDARQCPECHETCGMQPAQTEGGK